MVMDGDMFLSLLLFGKYSVNKCEYKNRLYSNNDQSNDQQDEDNEHDKTPEVCRCSRIFVDKL